MRISIVPNVLLALTSFALLAPASQAGGLKTHRDPVHKFSLKVFSEWKQVPTEVGTEHEVAKFYEKNDRGDVFDPELMVVRIVKEAKKPLTGGGREGIPEVSFWAPKSAWDCTIGMLRPAHDGTRADQKNLRPRKTRSADKVNGEIWTYEAELQPGNDDYTIWASLAVYEKDGIEYGIYLVTSKRRGEKMFNDFKRIAKSFKFFDEHAKDVREVDALADVDISPKRRAQIEAGMIKGWGIRVSPKKNYVVIYNTLSNKNHDLAKVIAERIEKLREQVYEVQFPPSRPIKAVSIVRVCGSPKEYRAYGGPGGSAGYWNSGTEELVFYDASPAKKIDDDTVAVLYHEAFHQYIFYSVGNVAPHSWFNEGHGDYYAGSKYGRGRFKVEPFRWRMGTVKSAIREGSRPFKIEVDEKTQKEKKVWENKGYTPLADLVRFSQGEYYSYPGVSYAQGWALIHFLREGLNRRQKEEWGHILDVYFNTLKDEVASAEGLVPGGPGGSGDDPDLPEPPDPEDPDDPDADDPDGPADPDDPDGDGEGEDGEPKIAMPPPSFFGGRQGSARDRAVEKAFEGVDFEALEKAWVEYTLKVN